jgi:hypothetical protein
MNSHDSGASRPRASNTQPTKLLIKLALRACERGDTETAAEALRGVLALPSPPSQPAPAPPSRRAVTLAKFARIVGYSARHLRSLLSRGVVPADAIIGSGRSKRILVERALEALRGREHAEAPDSVQAEGAAFVRRRARFRVVKGGASE